MICECSRLDCRRDIPYEVYVRLEALGDRRDRPWYIVYKDHLEGWELGRAGEWVLEHYKDDATPAMQTVGGSE